jgi:hypothetical protein
VDELYDELPQLAMGLIIIMENVEKHMIEVDWEISDDLLVEVLNFYSPKEILFSLGNKKSYYPNKYITEGSFGGEQISPDTFFNIKVVRGAGKFLRRFSKPGKRAHFKDTDLNQFLRELYDVLAHELVHALQAIEMDWEEVPIESEEAYFSHPREIEAYALQAAMERKRKNKSDAQEVYRELFGLGSKVYKMFMIKSELLEQHLNLERVIRNVKG